MQLCVSPLRPETDLTASIARTVHWLPKDWASDDIRVGFSTAAVLIAILSAPAAKRRPPSSKGRKVHVYNGQ